MTLDRLTIIFITGALIAAQFSNLLGVVMWVLGIYFGYYLGYRKSPNG